MMNTISPHRLDVAGIRAALASARATTGSTASADSMTLQPSASHAPDRTRRLRANPLFVDGADYDEFQLSAANVDFAAPRFNLDAPLVDMVKNAAPNQRFSVIYHTDDTGLYVDACRGVATVGKDAVFSVYHLNNPAFDPSRIYKNELIGHISDDRCFGTVLSSKRLAVPSTAPANTLKFLADNGYQKQETVTVGSQGYGQKFKDYFGLNDAFGIDMYAPHKTSFAEKFKVFYRLFTQSPDYRMYKLGISLNYLGTAMTLGVITPKLWGEGSAYGVAGTISSIDNIGSPALNIGGESLLGGLVDKAVNSDRPLDSLKKIKLGTAGLSAGRVACFLGLYPALIHQLGNHPGAAFVGLYAGNTVLGSISSVVNGKADIAIHDQLINKAPSADYSKDYYQILGVESSIDQAIYLGAYSATVAISTAFPAASLGIACAGAGLWAASNFVWPLFHDKPEVKTSIEGTAFVHQGDRYIFDSGWEASFQGGQGHIEQDDADHFSINLQSGDLYLKSDSSHAVTLHHERHLDDYLPAVLKGKWMGEKERWDLDNGESVDISRYGNTPYHLKKISDTEYLLSAKQDPGTFWKH